MRLLVGDAPSRVRIATGLLALLAGVGVVAQDNREGFRFRSGVELINVTATVTDDRGRFVSGLDRDDFVLYEDGQPVPITHFSSERVPVSLGIAIDTSGSMSGEKWDSARSALDRFLYDLLSPEDEIFLYRFSDSPDLVEPWTTNRDRLSNSLGRIRPRGGTALYDTVAEALPMAQSGAHRKKALVIISDGNDTSSTTMPHELERGVRETEVLVYAIGIDGAGEGTWTRRPPTTTRMPPARLPFPFPWPGGRQPQYPPPGGPTRGGTYGRSDDRVNISALRSLTDDSGGRTEVIRTARDLDPATAGIASELSQQYYIGYAGRAPKDGRWHTIDLQVRSNRAVHVRHRRGYIATP